LGKSLKRTKEFNQKKRKINTEPFKKGYVPNWRDNFYTNLLDWNNKQIIFAASD
jgi:WD40 repeat protein